MTICPIAIAVGCKKCPAFKFCPLTTVLGDQQEEDEVDASPMTLAHDRDWSEAISQKEIPYTSDDPDFLSTNRSTVPKKSKPKSAGSTNTPVDKIEDEYQSYAEEELKKNTKQMESFKGEDAEVITERKKLTKDERLALIKESAEKKKERAENKSAHENEMW
jgi:hypothetical protein